MKHAFKTVLLALFVAVVLLTGCEPDDGSSNPPPPPPTTDPNLALQNNCIRVDDPDPDMDRAIRLTNTCDYAVNIKFCIDPDGAGRPACSSPDTPQLSPGESTRAFPEAQEYALKMGVCKSVEPDAYYYDPGTREFRDNQSCEKRQ